MSNILVLGGNEEAFDGIQHIKKDLGHKVILCDGNPKAIARTVRIVRDFTLVKFLTAILKNIINNPPNMLQMYL